MISFDLGQRPRGVLAIGAHPDDVEIGCGGTLLQLASRWPGLPVSVVVMTGTEQRREEARVATELFLPGCEVDLRTYSLPDGALPAVWGEVKASLERVAAEADDQGRRFDLVLAPRLDDAHQDHRLLAGLVPTVWRDHLVLGYEIPKYDGDLGRPNLYLPLTDHVAVAKVRLLEKAFSSQVGRDWWDEEMFLGLARLRGMECRSRYAEAFALSKATWSW